MNLDKDNLTIVTVPGFNQQQATGFALQAEISGDEDVIVVPRTVAEWIEVITKHSELDQDGIDTILKEGESVLQNRLEESSRAVFVIYEGKEATKHKLDELSSRKELINTQADTEQVWQLLNELKQKLNS